MMATYIIYNTYNITENRIHPFYKPTVTSGTVRYCNDNVMTTHGYTNDVKPTIAYRQWSRVQYKIKKQNDRSKFHNRWDI